MSSEEKRAVVTLNKGVDASQFLDNMTTTFGSDAIPSRSVTLHNEKVDSVSNFDFVLTKAEAKKKMVIYQCPMLLKHNAVIQGITQQIILIIHGRLLNVHHRHQDMEVAQL